MTRLDDGDTFERDGRTFRVKFARDDDMGEPWKEHDGHGIVSDWTRRDKAPGERVLIVDDHGGSKRYYDVAATMKIAIKDGWGCGDPKHTHQKKREAAACAVDRDFKHLRAWCADEWEWIYVQVTHRDEHGKVERASLGGIESDRDSYESDYLTETAHELADEINAQLDERARQVLGCVACKGTGEIPVRRPTHVLR